MVLVHARESGEVHCFEERVEARRLLRMRKEVQRV